MREMSWRSQVLDVDAMEKERLALHVYSFAIGADDVLRPVPAADNLRERFEEARSAKSGKAAMREALNCDNLPLNW